MSLQSIAKSNLKKFLTIIIWVACVMLILLGIAEAQSKTIVLMFNQGQEPTIAKMPQYAYCGMQPLSKEDQILDAVVYTAKGKSIYSKAIEYYKSTCMKKPWNPAKIRMLVIVKNENKAFSLSGNVSANFSDSINNTTNLTPPGGSLSKNTANTLSSSGGVFPSFSKSWTDQKFEIWFFLCE